MSLYDSCYIFYKVWCIYVKKSVLLLCSLFLIATYASANFVTVVFRVLFYTSHDCNCSCSYYNLLGVIFNVKHAQIIPHSIIFKNKKVLYH